MTAGIDQPDHRGRTGLHRAGRDLTRNPDIVVRDVELLASGWHVLRRTTYDHRHRAGHWTTEQRETYDRGNGATILLHDLARATVLLTRQFRYPAYVNGHPDGNLVETAAGLLDADDPEAAIRREAAEELGVTVGELQHVFDVYMSPGSVTELLHFYAAPYSARTRTGPGGGLADDGEDIDAVELPFTEALAMTTDGRIADAKTIMLLQWAALSGPFRELHDSQAWQASRSDAAGAVSADRHRRTAWIARLRSLYTDLRRAWREGAALPPELPLRDYPIARR